MSLDDYNLTLEEEQEAGKQFLDFINNYKYREALNYFGKLDSQAQKYIQTEGNCSWGLLLARDSVRFRSI